MEASRNFANKLWNATRFVVRSMGDTPTLGAETQDVIDRLAGPRHTEDRWIISRLNRTTGDVAKLMDEYQFGEAQRQIHDFLWSEYCDWYIELAKIRLQAGDNTPVGVLVHVLEKSLRLLHPFMPFITEELWQNLKPRVNWLTGESIMIAPYPEADEKAFDAEAEKELDAVFEIVRAIRNVRAEHKVEVTRWIEARIYSDASRYAAVSRYAAAVKNLAHANPVTFFHGEAKEKADSATLVLALSPATVVIPMASMVDFAAEKRKAQKEYDQTLNEMERLEFRLKDEAFLTKAPPAIVEKEKQKLYTLKEKLAKLQQQISRY
jgi:valyl-tRNA synthetase